MNHSSRMRRVYPTEARGFCVRCLCVNFRSGSADTCAFKVKFASRELKTKAPSAPAEICTHAVPCK